MMLGKIIKPENTFFGGLALTASCGPAGLIFLGRTGHFSSIVVYVLSLFWLVFNAVLCIANPQTLSLYAYLVTNAVLSLYVFANIPAKPGVQVNAKMKNIGNVIILIPLFFMLELIFPTLMYIGDPYKETYAINNDNVSLLYTNRLGLIASISSVAFFIIISFLLFKGKPHHHQDDRA